MAISNASRLSDFGSGIGSEGAVIQVDNSNKRLGVGTDTPLAMLQVGTGVSVYGDSGIVSASKYYGDGSTLDNAGSTVSASNGLERLVFTTVTSGTMSTCTTDSTVTWNQETSTLSVPNVSISGTMTQEDVTNVDSTGIVTAGNGFRATKGGIDIVAGVSTFGGNLVLVGAANQVNVTGVSTFAGYPSIDADNEIQVGTAIQLGKAGVITATSFSGSGANLTDVVSGISLQQAGSWVSTGTAATTFNFASGATLTNVDSGISTITISAGIQTVAFTTSNVVYDLDLSNYQDHKATVSGVTTFSCTGGTEGDSHTLRIVNSGVTTVGFSTYFLWPSGAMPSLPTTDGALSLISFTVHREGAVGLGTQLFAGASVDFR